MQTSAFVLFSSNVREAYVTLLVDAVACDSLMSRYWISAKNWKKAYQFRLGVTDD